MDLLHILTDKASLLEDAVQSTRREIIIRLPGNGDSPRLVGVFKLAMASLSLYPVPPVFLKHPYDITHFHESAPLKSPFCFPAQRRASQAAR
jgi:hypothetical protein